MDDIGEYMSSPVLFVDFQSSVQEAALFMQTHEVGSVLIQELGEYVGLVTETDLSRKVLSKGLNPDTTMVSDVMSQPIISIDKYLPVEMANEMMIKKKIRHLVVTEENKVVGMLSVKDLVIFYAKDFRMQE
ncbi:MAG: CBS domain-containing protein [Candidatus Nitrohelix vancouverensis]|uniref:CBS domain-containing protein n=1 Tax=Candidatus Nitrohelix vancouverensis TaxID=2705534 RepID=A0A7T0G2H6_9BACT|nr:MAG: CBS domain-containing protein [Candidatus Nitrohelix vancouverensis]